MKKTLVTLLSTLAIAFAAVGVATWGNGKTEVQSVSAEATYETATEYGLEDLMADFSGNHDKLFCLDQELLTADGKYYLETSTYRTYIVDKAVSENASMSIKFDYKNDGTAGESVQLYMGDSAVAIRPVSAGLMQFNVTSMTGGSKFPQASININEWHTYEFIKQYEAGTENFQLTIKVDGNEVTKIVDTGTNVDGESKLQIGYLKNMKFYLRSFDYATENSVNLETPVMIDIADNNPQLAGKTELDPGKTVTISKSANSLMSDYGTSSVGIKFRLQFNQDQWPSNEGFIVRFHKDLQIAFRKKTSGSHNLILNSNYSLATTNGNPNWVLVQQVLVFGTHADENTWEVIRQKNNGTAGGWVITIKVNDKTMQCFWVKAQEATDDYILAYANSGCVNVVRSATHYGVTTVIDGVETTVPVANGQSYTLPAYDGDKMFFGWAKGEEVLTETTVTEETTVTALTLGATNVEGVSLRWLHPNEASLKWTVNFDKSDYDTIVAFFGEENVALGYEITTANAPTQKIRKTGSAVSTVVNGDVLSFSVLLSHITESHYDWAFTTRTFIVVDGEEASVEDNNNTTSLQALAQVEYDLVSDEQTAEFKYEIVEGDDVGKYSKYSTAQRRVLEGYIA